jgi:hypothetical protein
VQLSLRVTDFTRFSGTIRFIEKGSHENNKIKKTQ